ncbi:hypothetical protein K501DRAFT_285465 [Backusella circina FSU 941]|nr:hypothetical protein K501DRAFT_285465 [Backusella circina FSU 941]
MSNDDSLKSKLEEDQKALKRMILILSLVGGLGIIAIAATIIIFTRMRAKSRRQKREQQEQQEQEDEEEEEENSTIPSESSWNPSREEEGGEIGDEEELVAPVEPSAPPAIQGDDNMTTRPRHILSMTSQTTPSAPTAKELDAVIEPSAATSSHVHSNACNYCLMPELPPPAYTPSAPPHYALPDEPVTSAHPNVISRISDSSSSSLSPCSSPGGATHTMPARRHSLGG